MLFVIHAMDKPDAMALRMKVRPDHLAYMKTQKAVVMGGPMLSDDGKTLLGSMLLVEAPDRAAVETLSQNDPYAKAGLFESVVIRAFKKVLPLSE